LTNRQDSNPIIALLGAPDSPTDALADYCLFLGRGLDRATGRTGYSLKIVCVPWPSRGWLSALAWLWREARSWRGQWVLVQYTALSWSRRGVPPGLLLVLHILRSRGARIAVVYHDTSPFPGARLKDRLRRAAQISLMRSAYRLSRRAILTVPLENVAWLPARHEKAVFIPVGANFDEAATPASPRETPSGDLPASAPSAAAVRTKTVAVFSVTGAPTLFSETKFIAQILRSAAAETSLPLRLLVMGRHADEAEAPLRAALDCFGIELEVHGVLPAEEIERRLRAADVLLFVRGGISSHRGSAIAGVACGLPVVAFSGPETGPPITDAGLLLAPEDDGAALAGNLARVLADDALHADLCRRSLEAREKYFSWDVIARRFLEVLNSA
jgi:glycosyltransferase involved in cell wall biosynthesis